MSTTPSANRQSSSQIWMQRLQNVSLRVRLTAGIMLITILSVAALSILSVRRTGQIIAFLNSELSAASRLQAEQALQNLVTDQADEANHFLQEVTNDINVAADYVTSLLAREEELGQGRYWDARQELVRYSENQWGNSKADPGSVIGPSTLSLTDEVVAELNSTIYLDLLLPRLLAENPSLIAIYFVSAHGATIYYPNIDLANIVGDFDARVRPYYTAVTPEADFVGRTYWTPPYLDAALNGFIETNSRPIYDENGRFRGVIAADVLIATITQQVSGLMFAESGYAFMVDATGRPIVLPEAGFADFGIDAAALPDSGIPEQSAATSASSISPIVADMLDGAHGLARFQRDGRTHLVAYAPVPSAGYSLGVVVPEAEMMADYLTANQRLLAETRTRTQVVVVAAVVITLLALAFSTLFGRLLTRPLDQLTQAAEEVAAGRLDVTVPVATGGEINQLATAFNSMTTQLRELVGSLEQRVAERTQALVTTTDVGRRLSTILDESELVAEVVSQVQRAFNYYHVHIYLFDQTGTVLLMKGGTGEPGRRMLAAGHKIPKDKGLVGRAASANVTVLVPDVHQDPNWLSNPLLPETRSEVAVPIALGEEVLGVLDVQESSVDGLSQVDADLLQSIANQTAIALRNARAYQQTQAQARQQALINTINQRIQSTSDIETAVQVAIREIGQATGASRVRLRFGSSPPDQAPSGDNGGADPHGAPPPETAGANGSPPAEE